MDRTGSHRTHSRRRKSNLGPTLVALAVIAVLVAVVIALVSAGCSAGAAKKPAAEAPGGGRVTPSSGATVTKPPASGAGTDAPSASAEASWTAGRNGQLVKKIKFFKTVPAPKGLAITPDNGEVWVTALVTQPSIGIYNPRTGTTLGSVDLGKNGAVEVIFNKAGTKAYASQMQSHRVYEIDVKSRRVLRKFTSGGAWTKVILLSPDETKLYAANWSGDNVSEIDLKSGKVLRTIKTADTPRGLYVTPDGKKLYIACFGEQTLKGAIQVVKLSLKKNGASRTPKTIGTGRAMRHMVADEQGRKLFTSDLGANCVWVTDLDTDTTKLFVVTDNKPNTIDISPDGRVLFVSNRGANNPASYNLRGPEWGSILLFDTKTGKPLDAIVGGNQCTALDVSPDGTLLAFSDFLDGRLRVYAVPPTDVLLAGGGGAYKAHLYKVRKDGSKLVVRGPAQ